MQPTAKPGHVQPYQPQTAQPLILKNDDLRSPSFSLRKIADGQLVAILRNYVDRDTRVWLRDAKGDWSEKRVLRVETYRGSEVFLLIRGEEITIAYGLLSKEKDTYKAERNQSAQEMTLVDLSKEAPESFGIQHTAS